MLLMLPPVEISITLAALVLASGLVGGLVWLERRPKKQLQPHLLPVTPLLFAGMIAAMLAMVHLINLLGYHTGR